jgi:hypothetical protein
MWHNLIDKRHSLIHGKRLPGGPSAKKRWSTGGSGLLLAGKTKSNMPLFLWVVDDAVKAEEVATLN